MARLPYLALQAGMAPLVVLFFSLLRRVDLVMPDDAAAKTVLLLGPVLLLIGLAALVRRLHDLGRGGFWALLVLALGFYSSAMTFALILLLVLVPGQRRANRFGLPPDSFPAWWRRWRLQRLESDFVKGTLTPEDFNAARAKILKS